MIESIIEIWNKYKSLILIVFSLMVFSLVIYYILFEAFLIVNVLFLVFFLVIAIVKFHYLYLGTALLLSAQVIDETYFYIYGSNSADIICMVFTFLGIFIILVVLIQGVFRIFTKKNFRSNALYLLFSTLVLGSVVFLFLTHSVSAGSINVFDKIGIYIVLNYIILILLTILTSKMLKLESKDVSLFIEKK